MPVCPDGREPLSTVVLHSFWRIILLLLERAYSCPTENGGTWKMFTVPSWCHQNGPSRLFILGAMKQILLDFCSSGACALIASHLSTAILSWVQHQIAVGLACGSKNDAGRPEEGRALL